MRDGTRGQAEERVVVASKGQLVAMSKNSLTSAINMGTATVQDIASPPEQLSDPVKPVSTLY